MFYADCTKSADRQVNAVKKLFSIIYCCLPDVFQEGNRSVNIGLAATSGMVWLLLKRAIEQQNDAGLFGRRLQRARSDAIGRLAKRVGIVDIFLTHKLK